MLNEIIDWDNIDTQLNKIYSLTYMSHRFYTFNAAMLNIMPLKVQHVRTDYLSSSKQIGGQHITRVIANCQLLTATSCR